MHTFRAGAEREKAVHQTHERKDNTGVDNEADDDEGDTLGDEKTIVESGSIDGEREFVGGIRRANHTKEGGDERGDESIDEILEGLTDNDSDGEIDDIASEDKVLEACKMIIKGNG